MYQFVFLLILRPPVLVKVVEGFVKSQLVSPCGQRPFIADRQFSYGSGLSGKHLTAFRQIP